MDHREINVPSGTPTDAIIGIVDQCAGETGLIARMKGALAAFPGCTHWHFCMGRESGTLELTYWPRETRLWSSVRAARSAGWVDAARTDLHAAIELRLKPIVVPNNSLIQRARAAASRAYCPYSNFPVGAAVETENGIFEGCNVENASYGLSICAERVAIFTAVAAGARRFVALAVSCIAVRADAPASERMPCGACRQVIAEFMPEDATVCVDGVAEWRVSELLPSPFRLSGEISN